MFRMLEDLQGIDLAQTTELRGTRGKTYCRLYQLDELESFLLGKLRDLRFTMSLIAQELSCQTREIIGLPIQCQEGLPGGRFWR
jgi:hypothetical protein